MWGGAAFPQTLPADTDCPPAASWREEETLPTPKTWGSKCRAGRFSTHQHCCRRCQWGQGTRTIPGRGLLWDGAPGAASGMPGSSHDPLPAASWMLPLELARVQQLRPSLHHSKTSQNVPRVGGWCWWAPRAQCCHAGGFHGMVRMLAAHPCVPVPPVSLPVSLRGGFPTFLYFFLVFNHSVIYYPCLQMPLIQIKLNLLTLLLALSPCCAPPPPGAAGVGGLHSPSLNPLKPTRTPQVMPQTPSTLGIILGAPNQGLQAAAGS